MWRLTFLVQVIKSARVMKKAVAHLIPFMEQEKLDLAAAREAAGEEAIEETESHAGTFLIATVKGDVHDIGKNIVAVVLGCNNYKVIDMGVMQPCEAIIAKAKEVKADIVGLSGLITPSLDEMTDVAKQFEKAGLKMPLLIGGATTSRMHTAVKIAPYYSGPAVHVLDASRSVVVVSSLLDEDKYDDFFDDVKETYAELREEHYASLQERKRLSIEKARSRKLKVDLKTMPAPPTPNFLGTKVVEFSIDELIKYIDWNPFFQTWQLRGKYPNRGYPKIFNDEQVGAQAKETFDEAQKMLAMIAKDKLLQTKGIIGIFPANSEGDDIEVYDKEETRGSPAATFYTLRQQAESDADAYLALSDFVAPKASGVADYLGMFAVTAGFGLDKLIERFEAEHDDYKKIMAEAIADRLAEAVAEKLHEEVRRNYWGYSKDEKLDVQDMLRVKYDGIRPAPGYPSQPDHTEKTTMWNLMKIKEQTGIELTESLAMLPASSVSGIPAFRIVAHVRPICTECMAGLCCASLLLLLSFIAGRIDFFDFFQPRQGCTSPTRVHHTSPSARSARTRSKAMQYAACRLPGLPRSTAMPYVAV